MLKKLYFPLNAKKKLLKKSNKSMYARTEAEPPYRLPKFFEKLHIIL